MLFIKVMAASFLLTLLFAAPYISRKAPELLRSFSKSPEIDDQKPATKADSPTGNSNDSLEELMATKNASGKQVKPSFDSMPVEFFPSNKAFALDFHKLPVDYLVPQMPELTRNAAALIKRLKEADLKAIEEQQKIAASADPGKPAVPEVHDATNDGGLQ